MVSSHSTPDRVADNKVSQLRPAPLTPRGRATDLPEPVRPIGSYNQEHQDNQEHTQKDFGGAAPDYERHRWRR
jgi:hypothetical protein